MLAKTNAEKLNQSLKGLETMTRIALAVLAIASGVYTYLGVHSLLDGPQMQVLLASVIYSLAVSIGIYAFWSYLLSIAPYVSEGFRRLGLYAAMAVGSLMIIAMSSWLNAAALAGSAAIEQHMAVTLEAYTDDLDKAHANVLGSEGLLPDVQRASERFKSLADDELSNGALTGSAGTGSVVQLLSQMGNQLDQLGLSIEASKGQIDDMVKMGQSHLTKMRNLVSSTQAIGPRTDRFAEEALKLAGVISALQETSIAPSVKRAAADLSFGFIAPIASSQKAETAERQEQVMATVKSAVDVQSAALIAAADSILEVEKVPTRRFAPLSTAEAVLRYASDFGPSWAGAISIDLLPGVLVLMLAIAHASLRREIEIQQPTEHISAAEMIRIIGLYQEINDKPLVDKLTKELAEAKKRKVKARKSRPREAARTVTTQNEVVGASVSELTPSSGANIGARGLKSDLLRQLEPSQKKRIAASR